MAPYHPFQLRMRDKVVVKPKTRQINVVFTGFTHGPAEVLLVNPQVNPISFAG